MNAEAPMFITENPPVYTEAFNRLHYAPSIITLMINEFLNLGSTPADP